MKGLIKFFEKHRVVLIINLVFILAFGVILFYWSKGDQNEKSNSKPSGNIRVEIAGAVNKPGVYTLENGKIVEDLIKQAGGLKDSADKEKTSSSVNRAEILSDGEKVVIPENGVQASTPASEAVAGASTASSSSSSAQNIGKVNINSANLSQLDSLPGIGPAYAQRIIDYRTSNGGFKTIDEIKNIKGIGDKTFEKFKDLISI